MHNFPNQSRITVTLQKRGKLKPGRFLSVKRVKGLRDLGMILGAWEVS